MLCVPKRPDRSSSNPSFRWVMRARARDGRRCSCRGATTSEENRSDRPPGNAAGVKRVLVVRNQPPRHASATADRIPETDRSRHRPKSVAPSPPRGRRFPRLLASQPFTCQRLWPSPCPPAGRTTLQAAAAVCSSAATRRGFIRYRPTLLPLPIVAAQQHIHIFPTPAYAITRPPPPPAARQQQQRRALIDKRRLRCAARSAENNQVVCWPPRQKGASIKTGTPPTDRRR